MNSFSEALLTRAASHRPTGRHVARAGLHADAVPWSGMPAYESEHGMLVVMESLVVWVGAPDKAPMVFPMSYRSTSIRAPDCLAALHDSPDAMWSWRPNIYSLGAIGPGDKLGSQQELAYRLGLYEAACATEDMLDRIGNEALRLIHEEQAIRGPKMRKNARKRLARQWKDEWARIKAEPHAIPSVAAGEKADRLLLEFLSPQQRLDLLARDGFYVRGRINPLYEVRPGEGAAIVDPVTLAPTVSLCLHPEGHIPHGDVALATKLGIEAGEETEAELLEAANPTVIPRPPRATEDDRAAYRLTRRYALDR